MSNINELFVPYAESLQLKQLGFKELCLGVYLRYMGSETFELAFYKHKNVDFNATLNIYVSAPTFSQAFRFFREKYNYYISVFRTHDSNWGVDLWLLGVHKPKATIFSETYEQAELECLRKLIEICRKLK